MDKISNFFKDLKERVSNPFFFSFIISWLLFNWKIWVSLVFYKNSELKLDGYNSYLDIIEKNLSTSNATWKPLIGALVYTFIFPFFRNCIIAFNSWIKSWGNTWSLSLSKTSKISITKYIELREFYHSRTSLLQDVLEKESQHFNNYEKEKNKSLELESEKNRIADELNIWRSMNDSTQLDGEWEIQYLRTPDTKIYRVRIMNSTIQFLDNPPPDKNGQTLIRFFSRTPNTKYITLVTQFENALSGKTFHYFQLDILDNMKVLRGVENDKFEIEFRKTR